MQHRQIVVAHYSYLVRDPLFDVLRRGHPIARGQAQQAQPAVAVLTPAGPRRRHHRPAHVGGVEHHLTDAPTAENDLPARLPVALHVIVAGLRYLPLPVALTTRPGGDAGQGRRVSGDASPWGPPRGRRYGSTLMARAARRATMISELNSCTIRSAFTRRVSGKVSVGLKAVALVNATKR